jgi:hypothetical protein
MSRLISANPMFWRRRGGQTQAVISPVLSDKGSRRHLYFSIGSVTSNSPYSDWTSDLP